MYEGALFKVMRILQSGRQQPNYSSTPSSPKPDSGLATPEPPNVCAPAVSDFPNFFQDSNYTFNQYDFPTFPSGEAFLQEFPDFFGARSDDDGCASASVNDSAYGTVRDAALMGQLPIDLPAGLGFQI